MNHNPIAITTRRRFGACAWVCAVNAHMSRKAEQLSFGGASPHPGHGGVSS